MVHAVAGLLVALLAGAPAATTPVAGTRADVTGKWEGKLTSQNEDGTTKEDTALLILTQKEAAVTGTAGGNESDQHPITSGTIEGNKLTLVAQNRENGREYKIEVTVENDEMKGTVTSGERHGDLVLKKRKEY